MPRTVVSCARCIEARPSTWSTTRRAALAGLAMVVGEALHDLVEAWPGGGGAPSRESLGGGLKGVSCAGKLHADRFPAAGKGRVAQVGEVVFVLFPVVIVAGVVVVVGVVRAVLLVGRVVRVVVDGECGGDEVCKVNAVQGPRRRAGATGRTSDFGLPLRMARTTGAEGNSGVRLIGRGLRRSETRAAMSRAMEVLPEEGYPAMRVSLPRGMRLGQSQSGGCWMRNRKGWRPAPCAPEEL